VTKKKSRPVTERSARRSDERALKKVLDDRERLFRLEPGGSAERPVDVPSASVVEVHALAVRCPRCGGAHEILEHAAVSHDGARLRQVRLRCRQCGSERELFFRLRELRPN
jgi:ribosomal protein L44E